MSKHTKTPWTPGKGMLRHDTIYGADRADGRPKAVAIVYGDTREEQVANMRRIAAVDDVLAACKAHQAAEDHYDTCEDCGREGWCTAGEALYMQAIDLRKVAIAKAEPRDAPPPSAV